MIIDTEKFVGSKTLRRTLCAVGALAILALTFHAGIEVGEGRAEFHYKFGGRYYQPFDRESRGTGMMGNRANGGFAGIHGAAGKIASLTPPTMVVLDRENIEKVVRFDGATEFRKFRDSIAASDLAVGDFVLVIGEPNDNAEIEAKLIRILPSPIEAVTALPATPVLPN